MPPDHARMASDFARHIQRTGSVKMHIRNGNATEEVSEAFQQCVREFSELRSFHLNIATTYLTASDKGTGASTFRVLLKEIIANTKLLLSSGTE